MTSCHEGPTSRVVFPGNSSARRVAVLCRLGTVHEEVEVRVAIIGLFVFIVTVWLVCEAWDAYEDGKDAKALLKGVKSWEKKRKS